MKVVQAALMFVFEVAPRDISSQRVTLPVNFCLFSYGIATAVATPLLLARECY